MMIRVKTSPRWTAWVVALGLAAAAAGLVGCGGSGGPAKSAPIVETPPPGMASLPAVQTAKASVVRIVASGCNPERESSGWVAPGRTVVTAADSLAGARRIEVYAAGSSTPLAASLVAFDTRTDVAVLHVGELAAKPLTLAGDANPTRGMAAALLGYPDNAVEVDSALIDGTVSVTVPDAYGRPVGREVVAFLADGPLGFAGGPLLNGAGNVIAMDIGTLFQGAARAAVPDLPVTQALNAQGPASTGTCPKS
jgi:S1-C subfamily serine protease